MRKFSFAILLAILALALAACGSTATGATQDANDPNRKTVTVTDNYGTVTVPVKPKNVVALDNRTFETLADWGIELAAVPKGVMPADSKYVADKSVQDIGNHREPNLEIIAAVNPELVIVGQRFADFYEDIKKLVPNAAVIHVDIDVAATDGSAGENLVKGFKDTTTMLGQIFDKEDEAKALNAKFDEAIEAVKAAYNGEDTVMSVIVTGGNIGYSAPRNGRVWGPLFDVFDWVPSLSIDNATSDHQGDEISVEAIAQSNPDWLLVLDRDAAITTADQSTPARDVIENAPALQKTTAVSKKQIVYAPADTYTNESIQTYIEILEDLAKAFNQ